MGLDAAEVRHVAMLARLALTDDEIEALAPQLAAILTYAEQVSEVAASDVPPTVHAVPLRNVWRPDEPCPGLTQEEALSGAPEVEDGRFVVPRILAEEG